MSGASEFLKLEHRGCFCLVFLDFVYDSSILYLIPCCRWYSSTFVVLCSYLHFVLLAQLALWRVEVSSIR